MNQEKIGKFIAECRKEQGITQTQLADRLDITYKAVSKWESGRGLPDASRMIELCDILNITVNDLLSGEKVSEHNYVHQADDNLVELQKQKEAVNTSAKISYLCMVFILFVYNFVNMLLYGMEEATNKPEFMIMISLSLIWLIVYTYMINKIDNKKNVGYVIVIFVIGAIMVLLIPLLFVKIV